MKIFVYTLLLFVVQSRVEASDDTDRDFNISSKTKQISITSFDQDRKCEVEQDAPIKILNRSNERCLIRGTYMNFASPNEMKITSLYIVKLFGPPLLAYSLDRLSMHWMENILSHQQKTGEPALKVFNNLRIQKTLFKGLFGRSLTIAPARVLTLTTYYSSLDSLVSQGYSTPMSSLVAGMFAGIVDATATCPGENSRTRATFDLPKPSSLKESYRGYWALLARSAGAPIILSGATLISYYNILPEAINNGWYAGLITGALSQIITSPCDVIKNDLMAHPQKQYTEAFRNMISSKSSYRGIGTKVIRMSVGSAIVVGVIEYINGIISK